MSTAPSLLEGSVCKQGMFMGLEAILGLIQQLSITAVATGLFAWAAFKWFGKKWLESQFAQRLERFKHEQNQEIERLRYRINALMDRTAKLHQHEFEVLPGLWSRIGDAVGSAQWAVSRSQIGVDLDRMPPDVLEDFFLEVNLSSREKDNIRSARDGEKSEIYAQMGFWRKITEAKNQCAELNNYLLSKGIFIQEEIKIKTKTIISMIDHALVERENERRFPDRGINIYEKSDLLLSAGIALLGEIELDVQRRLWDSNSLE